ncbi:MAG: hypothetical protein ACT4PM_09500 [Gemmatimonadales bacterium]
MAPSGVTLVHPTTQQMTAAVSCDAGIATAVTWSASPASVATINASGLLTTAGTGNVAVQACVTAVPTVCGVATLSVTTGPVPTVTQVLVSPANAVMTRPATGTTTLQLTAAVIGTNNPPQAVTWSLATAVTGVSVSATGLLTISSTTPAGTFNVQACSTLAGFTTVCGSAAVNVQIPAPATVSIQSITWVPQTPGTCIVIPASVPQPVVLTNVNCQIEVTANVNAGDQQLGRLDILIGGEVVASQTFPGTVAAEGEEAAISAPVDITQSVNTRQLQDAGANKIPVIFNGNKQVVANLYVVGAAVPLASNAVPVVMNNLDIFHVTPGIDGASLLRTAVVAPAPVVAGGATWWKGTQTASGNFIAYSATTPTAFVWAAGTVCATTPAGVITGTPTAGIVVAGVFACAAVEGQNFLNGASPTSGAAGSLVYGTATTGPDGTVLATGGAPLPLPAPGANMTALTYTNVGSAYTVPTGPLAAPAPESRYNPTPYAVGLAATAGPPATPNFFAGLPSGFIDNEGPSVDIASSTTLLFAAAPPLPAAAGPRPVSFFAPSAANPSFDQYWISGGVAASATSPAFGPFGLAVCAPGSTKTADATPPGGAFTAGVFAPGCGTSGYIAAADGGVGLDAATRTARRVDLTTSTGTAADACAGPDVTNGGDADIPPTLASSWNAGPGTPPAMSTGYSLGVGGYRLCTFALDLLANASATAYASATLAVRSAIAAYASNISNLFGVDALRPLNRLAGSTTGPEQSPTFASLAITFPTVSATANTTIYGPTFPFPATARWGVEGIDDRAGYNQNAVSITTGGAAAALVGYPSFQSMGRLYPPSSSNIAPATCGFTAAMGTLMSDFWVRTSQIPAAATLDCGTGTPGYFTYGNTAVGDVGAGASTGVGVGSRDRAGNPSEPIMRNYAIDQYFGPVMTGVGFQSALYTDGAVYSYGFSANDDLELIWAAVHHTYSNVQIGDGIAFTNAQVGIGFGWTTVPVPPLGGAEYGWLSLGTRWDAVLSTPLNGFPVSIGPNSGTTPGFIRRIVQVCEAAGVPHGGAAPTGCTGAVAGDPFDNTLAAAAPSHGGPIADLTTVNVHSGDVANTNSNALAAAILGTQLATPGAAAPFQGAPTVGGAGFTCRDVFPPALPGTCTIRRWSLTKVGATFQARHIGSTSVVIPFWDRVDLYELIFTGAVYRWTFRGTFAAPVGTDDGFVRIWTYGITVPALTSGTSTGFFRAMGVKGGSGMFTNRSL